MKKSAQKPVKFYLYGLLAVLIVGGVCFSTIHRTKFRYFDGLYSIAQGNWGSIDKGVHQLSIYLKTSWQKYMFNANATTENIVLKNKIAKLELKIFNLESKLNEYAAVQELVYSRAEAFYNNAIIGRILYSHNNIFSHHIHVHFDANQPVTNRSVVLNSDGIIGRMINQSNGHGNIEPIFSHNVKIDAINARTRKRVLWQGYEQNHGTISTFNSRDVKIGDLIVSSGQIGLYPPHIPLGTISTVERLSDHLTQNIIASTSVDFNNLDFVFIMSPKVLKRDNYAKRSQQNILKRKKQ